ITSYTLDTNLWLERSRLSGMILGAVSYGMFLLLTIQAGTAILHRRGPHGVQHPYLLVCPRPVRSFSKFTDKSSYYIMEWFMQALLFHRCFIIFGGAKYVAIPMGVLFLTMVVLSILVLAEASGAVYYNIKSQLAFLCIEVGMSVIYTLLVVGRLLRYRRRMESFVSKEHLRIYDEVMMMVLESAALYSILGIIFIISFALHSYISNLVFLAISHVQAIAQLFIIIRVAQGRAL
ncbi:hypothetical protein SCLCIDRAFT_89285, partial [Scleroderma citrinum Foug A]